MKLEILIYDALVSLSKVQTREEPLSPNFDTAKSGRQVCVSGATENRIRLVSAALLKLSWPGSIKLDLKEHHDLVKKAIIERYDGFLNFGTSPCAIRYLLPAYLKGEIKQMVTEFAPALSRDFTCHLPAALTGLEIDGPFVIGPVTIYKNLDWIDSIDFPPSALDYMGGDNSDWRENLKAALVDKDLQLKPLSASLYEVVTKSKSMISVTTAGYGKALSRKLSTILARTALDSISLIGGSPKYFRSFTLYTERRPPILTHSIVETNGFLWNPGLELSDEVNPFLLRPEDLDQSHIKFFEAVSKILTGLIGNGDGCPGLCQRWSTALDWHGEACREVSDQIAIAKFGTCLDVLSSGGGKTRAISKMVSNLTKTPEDKIVANYDGDLTLYETITKIYEHGRSEILHGNKVDRMTSFEVLRGISEFYSKIALIKSAEALLTYSGSDSAKAFSDM
ncbi:hypothetical protein [Pseudomonas sp. COW5]|uniref:hypothetical protein n=1 Tax=Pseudomonas sp. COW5 TaxID=2981253 RepID=UPI002245AAF4|nr:hypothetical protein [Pseudomonas sp. COW5]MCX2545989.1 hypothetical protein [Pseudomonas sp. COW5]